MATVVRNPRVLWMGAALFIAAAAFLGWQTVRIANATTDAQDWIETRCTIVAVDLRKSPGSKQRSRRHLDVRYSYAVNGRQLEGDQWSPSSASRDTDADQGKDLQRTFAIGSSHACWYDPQDPIRAALDRSMPSAVYWLPLLGLMFVAAGGFAAKLATRRAT